MLHSWSTLSLCALIEVQIKVQVFDNSDLSPLAAAQVEVHGNQTILASSRAGSDGVLRVSFLYRTGTWVIITASKQDYVTNSVPWHSSRIPCKSPRRKVQIIKHKQHYHPLWFFLSYIIRNNCYLGQESTEKT